MQIRDSRREPRLAPKPTSPAPAESTSHSSFKFRPDIEGLRGIAVLLVVLYHAGIPYLPGGFVGVDVFFVLSGYLITGLLVHEISTTGSLNLPQFYARRARRLLPAAALMTAATLAVGWFVFSPVEYARSSLTALATALYASNVRFMAIAGNYFGAALETDPFLHTWSLGVEEQFYFVWPALVALAFRGASPARRLAVTVSIASAVTLALSVWLTWYEPTWAFFASPVRAWEFGVGAMAYLVPLSRLKLVPSRLLGWAGLAAVVGSALWMRAGMNFPGAIALIPVLGTAAALLAGARGSNRGVGRLLAARWLQWLGKRSYSWYLWHWPALVIVAAVIDEPSVVTGLACAVASLGIAAAAYRYVENPVRFSGFLTRSPRRSLEFAAALMICTLTLSLLGRNAAAALAESPQYAAIAAAEKPIPTASCVEWRNGTPLPSCDTNSSAPVVVLFGDSHAAQWTRALVTEPPLDDVRVIMMTRSGCPAAAVPVYNPRQGRRFNDVCNEWRRSSLDSISAIRPSMVVVASSHGFVEGRRRKDSRRRVSPAEWQEGWRFTLERLNSVGMPIVFVRDTPLLGYYVPTCLSRAQKQKDWSMRECSSARSESVDDHLYQIEKTSAEGLSRVSFLDMTEELCSPSLCYAEIGGTVVYRDYDHISAPFAERLSPIVWSNLMTHFDTAGARR